nr:cysteine peptidase family C39 domain-containing protein [uncultured Tyzzerella sp.]
MFIIRKYICVKQNDEKDCGVACLATICECYGLKKNISKIREISGTDNDGTSALGLIKGAEKLGFSAKGVKGDKESIFSEFPLPAIAHTIVDNKFFHYIVIHKISNKHIIVADPAKGVIKYSTEDFFKIWTGILIILKPTIEFKKGNEKIGLIERFLPLIISQRFTIFQVILCSLFTTILGLFGSFYIKFLLDDILPYSLRSTLHIISIGVIVAYIFQVLFSWIRSHLLLFVSQKFDISLLLGYYEHIMKLPMNFFSTRKTGEIISRFNDAISIKKYAC